MAESEEIDRLKRRLNWEGANRATDALMARGGEFVSWVRERGEDQPMVSLLVAFQIGFAIGRWGPRRAKP